MQKPPARSEDVEIAISVAAPLEIVHNAPLLARVWRFFAVLGETEAAEIAQIVREQVGAPPDARPLQTCADACSACACARCVQPFRIDVWVRAAFGTAQAAQALRHWREDTLASVLARHRTSLLRLKVAAPR
eukprot:1998038-Pleurochrysis_carterae.AAC.1